MCRSDVAPSTYLSHYFETQVRSWERIQHDCVPSWSVDASRREQKLEELCRGEYEATVISAPHNHKSIKDREINQASSTTGVDRDPERGGQVRGRDRRDRHQNSENVGLYTATLRQNV